MIPSLPSSGLVRDGSPGRPQGRVKPEVVTLAQECVEGAALPYIQDHFCHPGVTQNTDKRQPTHVQLTKHSQRPQQRPHSSRQYRIDRADEVSQGPTSNSQKLARVPLTKVPSPPGESKKFFVRTAGGMSVPVPEFTAVSEAPKLVSESSPVPQLEETTEERVAESTGPSGNYLPVSVELIAGRGQTSMPSDGNKNSVNPKVRSLPPSHTLALSASLLKSYFTSSGTSQPGKSGTVSAPDTETVKTKVMGIWNNVKYGWTVNLKTNFSRDSPVYLLGCVYHKSLGEDGEDGQEGEHGMEWFKRHFYTLVWCTYRRQFPALQDSTLTTDCGWGCMLRSGQMMLAQALTRHYLSNEWRYKKPGPSSPHEEATHRAVVRWLGDAPSPHCPLSLHNLVHLGRRMGKKAGDWYGPASVAYICKEAVEMGSKYIADLKRVCVYVAQDCAVYIQDVLDLCSSECVCEIGVLNKLAQKQSGSHSFHNSRTRTDPDNADSRTHTNSHTFYGYHTSTESSTVLDSQTHLDPYTVHTSHTHHPSVTHEVSHTHSKGPVDSTSHTHTSTHTLPNSHTHTSHSNSTTVNHAPHVNRATDSHPTSLYKHNEIMHSVSHSLTHPPSQLPQSDPSAGVNITRINVKGEAVEQPVRLYVKHSENSRTQNGDRDEGRVSKFSEDPPCVQSSFSNGKDITYQCSVNPLYENSIASVKQNVCSRDTKHSQDPKRNRVTVCENQNCHSSREVRCGTINESRQGTVDSKQEANHTRHKVRTRESDCEKDRQRQERETHDRQTGDNTRSEPDGHMQGEGKEPRPCPKCENWRSVLIMVPVRLGGESLNPIYHPCIYSLFTHDLSVGIIGGRPKHSLYFVGFQEESLIHLDPHLVQDAVTVTEPNFPLGSYHCAAPRKMAVSRMDPSATFGFYCHTRTDFFRLMEELPELVTPKEPGMEYPIFEFVDGRNQDNDACARQVTSEDHFAANQPQDTPLLPQDTEEFVFL